MALLRAICGISVAELVVACTKDAGFDHLVPFELGPEDVEIVAAYLTARPEEKALVAAKLRYLVANRPAG